jgi:hypothetical protein
MCPFPQVTLDARIPAAPKLPSILLLKCSSRRQEEPRRTIRHERNAPRIPIPAPFAAHVFRKEPDEEDEEEEDDGEEGEDDNEDDDEGYSP